jgi:hypothetical protein
MNGRREWTVTPRPVANERLPLSALRPTLLFDCTGMCPGPEPVYADCRKSLVYVDG